MSCPSCGAACAEALPACPACGVDFLKWASRSGAAAPAARTPAASRPGLPTVVATSLVLGAMALSYRSKPPPAPSPTAAPARTPAPRRARSRAALPPPVPVTARDAESRLAPMLVRARTEAQVYGAAPLAASDLVAFYAQGAYDLSEYRLADLAKEAGLPPPPVLDVARGEGFGPYKALVGGQWRYGGLPTDGGRVAECWQRGVREGGWVRLHWQPRFRRWSRYEENEALRLFKGYVDRTLSGHQEDADRAAALPRLIDPRLSAEAKKRALRESYRTAAMREGALAALE